MIHLTFGTCDGRPLCHCHRGAHQAMGDCFLALSHASASLLASDELCIGCRLQLDDRPLGGSGRMPAHSCGDSRRQRAAG
jgi:hypothetical protein